jgi:hypothetical protein
MGSLQRAANDSQEGLGTKYQIGVYRLALALPASCVEMTSTRLGTSAKCSHGPPGSPLMSATLADQNGQPHALAVTFNHLASDFWHLEKAGSEPHFDMHSQAAFAIVLQLAGSDAEQTRSRRRPGCVLHSDTLFGGLLRYRFVARWHAL